MLHFLPVNATVPCNWPVADNAIRPSAVIAIFSKLEKNGIVAIYMSCVNLELEMQY